MAFSLLSSIALLWLLLIVILKLLDSLFDAAISRALRARRITLKLFLLRCQSHAIPPCLPNFARRHRSLLTTFFQFGACIILLLAPFVLAFLVLNLVSSLSVLLAQNSFNHHPVLHLPSPPIPWLPQSQSHAHILPRHLPHSKTDTTSDAFKSLALKSSTNATTSPPNPSHTSPSFLPPRQLQYSQIPLILLALLFSTVIHELGHLLAALAHQAQISHVGFFLVFVFPGAFVSVQNLSHLPFRSQIPIVCAGVWHNLLTAVAAFFLIIITPFVLLPFYTQNHGALVTSLPFRSGLRSTLTPGDIILAVDNTNFVNTRHTFESVLSEMLSSPKPPAFCLPEKLFPHHDAPCCRTQQWRPFSPRHTTRCFIAGKRAACLDVVKSAQQPRCSSDDDCGQKRRCSHIKLTGKGMLVMLTIKRHKSGISTVFFDGTVSDLWRSVQISTYTPRGWQLLPLWLVGKIAWLDLPTMILECLWYMTAISATLAISNMAPARFLDGEFCAEMIVRMVAKRWRWKEKRAEQVRRAVVWGSTALMSANVWISIWGLTH